MSYKNMRQAVADMEQHKQLKRIKIEVDPNLEMAEIHRRVYDAGGPALLFERVKGSPFQAISNIYGTHERTDFLFRNTIEAVKKVIELKLDPTFFLKKPTRYLGAPFTALEALPMKVPLSMSPINYGKTTIDKLPQVKSWGMDGGAFVTLPQVYTEDPEKLGIMGSNIGMYRIQLSGNEYVTNKEIGLHYQIHRGIGVHHEKYNKIDEPFRCSIFVGGPPSHALAAIFPLPEGLPEVTFAGMLNGRRFRYAKDNGFTLSSDADFVITGIIKKGVKKPEGPFGDHLGYYSLQHDFPYMEVENVYHRKDPLWHFSVVGRPPAEDSSFGYMIHQLVKPLAPQEFPGLVEIHAVDAAGVHPLLLAIGKERYMPFRDKKPEEILTIANRILGSGQTSLAKFLFIAAEGDTEGNAPLDTHDIPNFFNHILERIDLNTDLHFQTKTTIDTLDYSGSGWNAGSKIIVAAAGKKRRELTAELPENFTLPPQYSDPKFVQKGILAIKSPKFTDEKSGYQQAEDLCQALQHLDFQHIPLILLVDEAGFTAQNVNNFVWTTFTRANPSHDIHGIHATTEFKHWSCRTLVIDARIKPHHAPPLITDKKVSERVDKLFAKGGDLAGII